MYLFCSLSFIAFKEINHDLLHNKINVINLQMMTVNCYCITIQSFETTKIEFLRINMIYQINFRFCIEYRSRFVSDLIFILYVNFDLDALTNHEFFELLRRLFALITWFLFIFEKNDISKSKFENFFLLSTWTKTIEKRIISTEIEEHEMRFNEINYWTWCFCCKVCRLWLFRRMLQMIL